MQNMNDWTDKFGRRLDIGHRVAACKGKSLHVGEILWFTKQGFTINSEDGEGNVQKVSIMYDFGKNWSSRRGSDSVVIL